MVVLHKKVGSKGKFYIEQDGKEVAEMVYTMPSADKMIIEHTGVDDSMEGHGIGLALVKAGVEYARESHIKIIPLCSFAKSVFDKKPEFRDLLA